MSKPVRTRKPAEAPNVTAQRAAEIFGAPDSLFTGRARVSSKGLQRGLSEMVARVYGNVPNVAPLRSGSSVTPCIALTYIGETAQCKYDWQQTAPKLKATATINLPVIGADDNMVPRSIADQYTAYALHELGHVLFTPLHVFRSCIYDISNRYGVAIEFIKGIVNALEDVDIERNIIAQGFAPGAATMLGALLSSCVAKVPTAAHGTMEAFSVTLAFGLRGYAPNAQAMVDALPSKLRAIYDAAQREMRALPLRRVGGLDNMVGVARVAENVIKALCDARGNAPQEQKPGEGQPGEGQPGEGQPGEGQPGEGQPGEGQPGEGQPGEGQPGEGQPGEGQPGEGQPGEGQPGEGQPGEGQPGEGQPGEGQPGEGQPGEGQPGEGQPGEGQPGEGQPGEGQPGEGTRMDIAQALAGMLGSLSCDMQPEIAGNPADGASGLLNDKLKITNAPDGGIDALNSMTRIATATLGKAPKVTQALRQLLDASAYDSKEGGRRAGTLRAGALHRVATGADTVFERRSYRDGSDSAVTLLIDLSSSMNSGGTGDYYAETAPVHHARNLAAALARLLSQSAGTTFECLGFNTHGAPSGRYSDAYDLLNSLGGNNDEARATLQRCAIQVFKTFKDAPAVAMRRLKSCSGSGGTPDAAAIVAACDRLLLQPAERRIFIMLADGDGSSDKVLSKILQKYEARGIICIGVGVGKDMNKAFQHRARVDDAALLGASGLATLLTAVAKEHAYLGGGDD